MHVCVCQCVLRRKHRHTYLVYVGWGGGASHSSHNPMTWIYDAHIYLIVLLIESLFKSAGESLVSLSCNLLSSGDAAGRQNENFRAERFVFCGILLQCSFFLLILTTELRSFKNAFFLCFKNCAAPLWYLECVCLRSPHAQWSVSRLSAFGLHMRYHLTHIPRRGVDRTWTRCLT